MIKIFFLIIVITVYYSCIITQPKNLAPIHTIDRTTYEKEQLAFQTPTEKQLLKDIDDITNTDNKSSKKRKIPESTLNETTISKNRFNHYLNKRFIIKDEIYDSPWVSAISSDIEPYLNTVDEGDKSSLGTLSSITKGDYLLENQFLKVALSHSSNQSFFLPSGGYITDATTPYQSSDEIQVIYSQIKIKDEKFFIKYNEAFTHRNKDQVNIIFKGEIKGLSNTSIYKRFSLDRNSSFLKILISVIPGTKIKKEKDVEIVEKFVCPTCSFQTTTPGYADILKSISDVNSFSAFGRKIAYKYEISGKPSQVIKINAGVKILQTSTYNKKTKSYNFGRTFWIKDYTFSPDLDSSDLGQVTGFVRLNSGKKLTESNIILKKLNGRFVALAKTDNEGFFHHLLPAGYYKIQPAIGNFPSPNQTTVKVKAYARTIVNLKAEISQLNITVINKNGQKIPFRLSILGKGDTKTPDLSFLHGYNAYKNFLYSPTGKASIAIPPGEYDFYISHGILYSICKKTSVLAPGKLLSLRCRLNRDINVHNYKTADITLFSNRSPFASLPLEEHFIMAATEGLNLVSFIDVEPSSKLISPVNFPQHITGFSTHTPWGLFSFYQTDQQTLNSLKSLFLKKSKESEKSVKNPTAFADKINKIKTSSPDTIVAYFPHSSTNGKVPRKILPFKKLLNQIDFLGIFHRYSEQKQRKLLRYWHKTLNKGFKFLPLAGSLSSSYDTTPGFPQIFFYASPIIRAIKNENDNNNEESLYQPKSDLEHILIQRNLTLTNGPLIDVTVNHTVKPGGTATLKRGGVNLAFRIFAATWMNLEQVQIIVNGRVYRTFPIPSNREIHRLAKNIFVPIRRKGWIYVLVKGNSFSIPMQPGELESNPTPLAFTNAIYINPKAKKSTKE